MDDLCPLGFWFSQLPGRQNRNRAYEKQRLKTEGTAGFTSSPWAYRGHIFCLSEDGDTYVIKAGDKYELERVNSLGEMCMATPAIVGDRVFIRTISNLYCVRRPIEPNANEDLAKRRGSRVRNLKAFRQFQKFCMI